MDIIGPSIFEVILQNELRDFIARTELGNTKKRKYFSTNFKKIVGKYLG
jgi:hypothetical protein